MVETFPLCYQCLDCQLINTFLWHVNIKVHFFNYSLEINQSSFILFWKDVYKKYFIDLSLKFYFIMLFYRSVYEIDAATKQEW